MKQSLAEQIKSTCARLAAAKPRSDLSLKIWLELRALRTKQLKREIRQKRAA